MKPATEILLSAAFALTPAQHFLQGDYALSVDGYRCDEEAQDAGRWCVVAAVREAARAIKCNPEPSLVAFCKVTKEACPETFNNDHTHAEVIAALYRAAELSEQS